MIHCKKKSKYRTVPVAIMYDANGMSSFISLMDDRLEGLLKHNVYHELCIERMQTVFQLGCYLNHIAFLLCSTSLVILSVTPHKERGQDT